jgi:hypothetical protein
MTGTKPSERALAAAKAISAVLRGPRRNFMVQEDGARIIDQHFRGHDELLAFTELIVESVRGGGATITIQDWQFEQAEAALAAAKDEEPDA